MLQARSTRSQKPLPRSQPSANPFKYRRCLIPADGFYEWRRTGTSKQPFGFEVNEGELFALAGLWDGWKDSRGQWMKTCSIPTTIPNSLTATVHNRMPVIIHPDHYDLWLAAGMQNAATISELLKPYDDYFSCRYASN